MASIEEQFKEIHKLYAPKILRLCLGYTGNQMQAEDLLQEIFIKIWENLAKFRGESQWSTWVYRISVNTCLLHLRNLKKEKIEDIDVNQQRVIDEGNEIETKIQLLHLCISKLAETDRLIISLLLEEVPYPEIAAATSISEGNLRVKIHRIKQQLATLYNTHERL